MTNIVILAAGMGTRLGNPAPKPLTQLQDGRTIMGQQVENIYNTFGYGYPIITVVGYKAETIQEAFPYNLYVHNHNYDITNTSKSLLKALQHTQPGGVLWFNGDVVFDPAILTRLKPYIDADQSFISVNTASVAEEEIKYTIDENGHIEKLSKTVTDGLGEAVGINYVSSKDKQTLLTHLKQTDPQDYFEKGIENAIRDHRLQFVPINISDLYAVEVDFSDDLHKANLHLPQLIK